MKKIFSNKYFKVLNTINIENSIKKIFFKFILKINILNNFSTLKQNYIKNIYL